ncbi:MAG: hypothetical protein WC710_14205 [Gallionella sp.]|jgi:hypothetical protein
MIAPTVVNITIDGCEVQFTRCQVRTDLLAMWLKAAHNVAMHKQRGGDRRELTRLEDISERDAIAYFAHGANCETCYTLAQARWDAGGSHASGK